MSRFSFTGVVAALAIALPATAQYSVTNFNMFQLDNGWDAYTILNTGTTVPTIGNVPGGPPGGTGPNLTPNDQMHYGILPKEILHAANGSVPPTMEFVGQQRDFILFHWGSGAGTELYDIAWDVTITPVIYTNPVNGLGPDGRRYPNLAAAPLLTIYGGAMGFAPPPQCPPPGNLWQLAVTFEYATAVPGTGFNLPADGNTDLAVCYWSPGNMSSLPADPTGCEVGGNLSLETLISINERVPFGVGAGNTNPYSGFRVSSNVFDNVVRTQAIRNWNAFRNPILQPTYMIQPTFFAPERGAGSMNIDATGVGTTVFPSWRTVASGHAGELVLHALNTDPVNFPLLQQPGFQVGSAAWLLLNPNDPALLLLTPGFDAVANSVPASTTVTSTAVYFTQDIADTPAPIGLPVTFAIPGPGFIYSVQSFVVNFGTFPATALSSNVLTGNIW